MIDHKDQHEDEIDVEFEEVPAVTQSEGHESGWPGTFGWVAFLVFVFAMIWGKELIDLIRDLCGR
jgi:hypothetical protein